MYELLFVGAGPHCLTALLRLLEPSPDTTIDEPHRKAVAKAKVLGYWHRQRTCAAYAAKQRAWLQQHVAVVDPAGDWLVRWQQQFAGLGITHLRSTTAVHPDPLDSYALATFASAAGRLPELLPLKHIPKSHQFAGPFAVPGAELFEDFCADAIARYCLDGLVTRDTVVGLTPVHAVASTPGGATGVAAAAGAAAGAAVLHWQVQLASGRQLLARHVIIGIGSTNRARVPEALQHLRPVEATPAPAQQRPPRHQAGCSSGSCGGGSAVAAEEAAEAVQAPAASAEGSSVCCSAGPGACDGGCSDSSGWSLSSNGGGASDGSTAASLAPEPPGSQPRDDKAHATRADSALAVPSSLGSVSSCGSVGGAGSRSDGRTSSAGLQCGEGCLQAHLRPQALKRLDAAAAVGAAAPPAPPASAAQQPPAAQLDAPSAAAGAPAADRYPAGRLMHAWQLVEVAAAAAAAAGDTPAAAAAADTPAAAEAAATPAAAEAAATPAAEATAGPSGSLRSGSSSSSSARTAAAAQRLVAAGLLCPGDRVLIVGGGLTTVHLAALAAAAAAGTAGGGAGKGSDSASNSSGSANTEASATTLLLRSTVRVKQFDVDVQFMGRFRKATLASHFQCLKSNAERARALKKALQGGSIPPEAAATLQQLQARRQVQVLEGAEIVAAEWDWQQEHWHVWLQDGSVLQPHRLWLATGSCLDAASDPLLGPLLRALPIATAGGLPAIQRRTLEWAPGARLHVLGAFAALALGPGALNLAGAKTASVMLSKQLGPVVAQLMATGGGAA